MSKNILHAELVEQLRPLATKVVDGEGSELVGLEFRGRTLIVTIDRDEGVRLSDCADVGHQLSTSLDVEDIIPFPYTLEVSSPGVDRPLGATRDFIRVIGRKLRVTLAEPVAGSTALVGTLLESTPEEIVLQPVDNSKKGRTKLSNPGRIKKELIIEAKHEITFRR